MIVLRTAVAGAAAAFTLAQAQQLQTPSGGAPQAPVPTIGGAPAIAGDLSRSRARQEIHRLLEAMYRGEFNEGWRPMERITTYPVRNVRVHGDGLEFEFSSNMVTSAIWGTRETVTGHFKVLFRDLQPVTVSSVHPHLPSTAWYAGPSTAEAGCTRKCGNFFWLDRRDAERFAQALNVMIARAGARDDFEEFRAIAARWRALERKPPLSADADRHRILAEHALQQNDLARAAAHYNDALEAFPGWPEGWMNAALLCEALKDYGCAADRMRHFLELLPSSREAAAAREKLVLWQELAKR